MSHTHWDREWYHLAERFQQRLVALIDELLDDPAPAGSFLLDGQTVVLEDYLDVRPERASEVSAAIRSGRLEAGPWFVLPDELIPSGEGLVRNLLAGARTLRGLRADSPPALYCPDAFGHPAALPELALGFDKHLIVVWRGRRGAEDTFWWRTPSGDRVLTYHLPRSGYELGASLPTDAAAARDRWKGVRDQLASRAATGLSLLLNGADHHARQRAASAAIEALRHAAAPDEVHAGTLAEFARDLARRATAQDLPELRGELRDSYGYTWTLQGTLASRAPQKRRFVHCERELVRDVEPWTALARARGGASRRHLTRAAWRPVLLCQPHDSLCGCSIDPVARAVDARLESASAQAGGLREDAIAELIGHDAERARLSPDRWKPMLLVRNRAARARSGVAVVELTTKLADVPVGPGSRHVRALAPSLAARSSVPGDVPVQILDSTIGIERTEAPRAYPDNDAVRRVRTAVWVTDVPAYGVASLPLFHARAARAARTRVADAVSVSGRGMANARLALWWDAKGRLTLEDLLRRRTLRSLVEWESLEDRGDLYTPSIRGRKLRPRHVRTRLIQRGPLRGILEQQWRLVRGAEHVELTTRFILDAGSGFLRIEIAGDNVASNHRLRLLLRTDVAGWDSVADVAFGTVQRGRLRVAARDARMEAPVPTAPLQRYVSRFDANRGITLYSDGLTEYETLPRALAVTLVRAVAELSRSDLPERPGHAGWPAATPEAQCRGRFTAELALMLHGPFSESVVDEIERAADDVLFPLTGETLRSALRVPPPLHGVALDGAGLAFSAAKESEDGEWMVLRCVNLFERASAGRWRLSHVTREARLARLDEMPGAPLPIQNGTVSFSAPPRGVVTILVR